MATVSDDSHDTFDSTRRGLLLRGTVFAGATLAGPHVLRAQNRTDTDPRTLEGQPVPEPPAERSAGPVKPGRGSAPGGKIAVVTGAARGIGRAIALEFAANGADVVVLDIVVADAAIQRWKPLLEMQDAEWRDVIDNNLNCTANTIRAFAPKMVARRHGRIIVLSSMQGKHGTKNASSYSASKWGIPGLMKSAALELGEYNITVNALIPGLVDTALTRYEKRLTESMAETGQKPPSNPTPQQAWDVRAPTVPLKVGWLQPDDISPAAVFLASDAAAMVTGAEYEVTGGDGAKDI
jgi:NAD(P)-dependent dehydrogenase (short-subunit alcohol dehydrogenase family)